MQPKVKTFSSYNDVKNEILRIIEEDMGIEKKADGFDVNADMYEMDPYLDSLDVVTLIMRIEGKMGIEIEDSAASKFRTLDDIIKYACYKQGIEVSPKEKTPSQDKKVQPAKPISFVRINAQSIKFVQDGKTLSLQDPQLQPVLKMLRDTLINIR